MGSRVIWGENDPHSFLVIFKEDFRLGQSHGSLRLGKSGFSFLR